MNTAEAHTSPQTAPAVSSGTTPGADIPPESQEKVSLSEGSCEVWTERMLEALARGNEGRKWHTLIDQVWSPKTLAAANARRDKASRGGRDRWTKRSGFC